MKTAGKPKGGKGHLLIIIGMPHKGMSKKLGKRDSKS